MQNSYKIKSLNTALLILVFTCSLKAQNFKLHDINKLTNSYPYNYQSSTHNTFATLNGVFYFAADDGIHGRELFRSDGTTGGTCLVKDIVPGSDASNVSDIIVSGNRLYFLIINPFYHQVLWTSDGTDAGTMPVAMNGHSSTDFSIFFAADVSGTTFFTIVYAGPTGGQNELWKTDNTGTSATFVAPINGPISEMANLNGKLFFTFFDYATFKASDLFVSDGTFQGTYSVKDLDGDPLTSGSVAHLTVLNGLLYFSANDGSGQRLWVSDGSDAGTYAVSNKDNIFLVAELPFGSNPFGVSNNTLFFPGSYNDPSISPTGFEICKFNTIDPAENVTLLKDINPGSNSSSLSNFCDVAGTFFFTSTSLSEGFQLWKSDGSASGTVLVKDADPGQSYPFTDLTNANGLLLFAYNDPAFGRELWRSDGTSAGTLLVKDIFPGLPDAYPDFLTPFKNLTYFQAASANGIELWSSDGTAAGTRLFKDINTNSSEGSNSRGFIAVGNKTIFSASNGINTGVYSTSAGGAVSRISDSTGTVGYLLTSDQDFFAVNKDVAYFTNYKYNLWRTDGTKKGTYQLPLPPFVPADSGSINAIVAARKLVYVFVYRYYSNTNELWRTDGTHGGTFKLPNDLSGFVLPYATLVGNELYYVGTGNAGSELWKTDGTVAGTKIVKTIGSYNYGAIYNLYAYKGRLIFGAIPPSSYAHTLWSSDGTDAGTMQISDVNYPAYFTETNGKLFFSAFDNAGLYGRELYVTDGTAQGTNMLQDINPGPASFSTLHYLIHKPFISVNKILYFIADDGTYGSELWRTDGTSEGTVMVRDVTPGYGNTNITGLASIHDRLYFVQDDTLIWQTDGIDINTIPVADTNLSGVSQITDITAVGDYLYFAGYTHPVGQELYIGKINSVGQSPQYVTVNPFRENKVVEEAASLQLKLSPDPVSNILHVQVNGLKKDKPSVIMLLSLSGTVLKSWSEGSLSTALLLDVSSVSAGVYVVKVITGEKVLYKQFVKM